MKQKSNYSTITVITAMLVLLSQQSALAAVTDYTVTGTYAYDEFFASDFNGDPIESAFLSSTPFGASSFTLNFSVDQDVTGNPATFNPVVFFNGAVSNVSLDIDGSNVLTTPMTSTVQQFPGPSLPAPIPARWSWSLFPGGPDVPSEGLMLPDLDVLGDSGEFVELLTVINPVGINFALFDPTQTVYGASGQLDLITLTPDVLGNFPLKEFSIFWDNFTNSSEDEDGGCCGEVFEGQAFYQAFFTVDSVVIVSPVPLPAAAWLFISALGGLVVAKRKQLKA